MSTNVLSDPFGLSRGIRRVVTGLGADGRATVVREDVVTGDIRGMLLWAADAAPVLGDSAPPQIGGWWPPPGGVRVCIGTRAPDVDEGLADPQRHPWPDIHDFEGFHTSASADLVFVIAGRIWLELDDGAEVELVSGDLLVQNGTRHRWRNRSREWPLLAIIIMGAAPGTAPHQGAPLPAGAARQAPLRTQQ